MTAAFILGMVVGALLAGLWALSDTWVEQAVAGLAIACVLLAALWVSGCSAAPAPTKTGPDPCADVDCHECAQDPNWRDDCAGCCCGG